MSRKRTSPQNRRAFAPRRRVQIVVAVTVVVSLFAAWTLLAYSGALDSVFRQKGDKKGAVSIASFNSNSPSKEYIYAGGRLIATEEPTATSPAATPPTGLAATAETAGQVHLTWNWSAAQGETLDHFVVERRLTINDASPTLLTPSPPTATSFDDVLSFGTVSPTGVVSGSVITYLYRVRAVNTASSTSDPSNVDLITTINYSQDQIQQFTTVVKKQDLAELRVAVNAVRVAAALPQFTAWTDPDLSQPSITIKTENIAELRGKLDEALSVINPPTQPPYTDSTLQKQITVIRKAHFNDLRKRVRHRST
jgi:hypothetical protein